MGRKVCPSNWLLEVGRTACLATITTTTTCSAHMESQQHRICDMLVTCNHSSIASATCCSHTITAASHPRHAAHIQSETHRIRDLLLTYDHNSIASATCCSYTITAASHPRHALLTCNHSSIASAICCSHTITAASHPRHALLTCNHINIALNNKKYMFHYFRRLAIISIWNDCEWI